MIRFAFWFQVQHHVTTVWCLRSCKQIIRQANLACKLEQRSAADLNARGPFETVWETVFFDRARALRFQRFWRA